MLNKNNKKKILALFLFSMIFLTVLFQKNLISNWNNDINVDKETSSDEKTDLGNIKKSEVLTDVIRINGSATGVGAHNWTWAAAQDWCSGSGIIGDPYVIANLEIDGQNSHSGIIIENSQMFDQYFRIENNIIYNIGGPDSESAGIKIYKSRYGTIRNNNISSSRDGNYGIHVIGDGPWGTNPSEYINITGNYITNTERGIHLEDGCREMTISENIAKFNSIAGIYIAKECKRLTVSNNIFSENNVFGIADTGTNIMMWMPDDGNTIFNNTIINNAYGFYLARTVYDKISYNNISSNSIHGLYISGSSENTIANNTFSNNNDKGILMVMGPGGSRRNKIYRNDFLSNGEHAADLTSFPWAFDRNNWSWWQGAPWASPLIGNYWDNYTGKDTDDDAVGDTPYVFQGNNDKHPIWNDGIEGHVIFINGSFLPNTPYNWTWASERFWCTGMGTLMDPYLIGPNDKWDGKIDAWGEPIGITIVDSDAMYFKITDNVITNSSFAGIKLDKVTLMERVISNNNISSNSGHGVYLDASNRVNITDNIISYNQGTGIYIYNGSGSIAGPNNVIGNTISNNGEDGLYIGKNSDNNFIRGNIISDNVQYGANIDETTLLGCNNTDLADNVFRDNGQNARDTGTNTLWYIDAPNLKRGNYWADYGSLGGKDGDDDGIGDTGSPPYSIFPYIIDADSNDNYPIWDDGLEEKALYIDGFSMGVNAHNWTWASKRLFVTGSGTEWDPYVIENVRFDGSDSTSAITILNSFVWFRIENCTLDNIGSSDSGSAGIYLDNADQGEIINCTYSTNNDGNYGIFLNDGCNTINITDNLIENANFALNKFKYGIYLDYSGSASPWQNVIDGNIIRNNDVGIFLNNWSSSNNLTNNEITDNNNVGIYLSDDSASNNIYNNEIGWNGNGTIIDDNCLTNKIIENNIHDNTDFGLYINTTSNTIYYNTFADNGINAKDDSSFANTWYNVMMPQKGNYWSNYTEMGPGAEDADDDGIGDITYDIAGTANAEDWYPIYEDGHNGSRIEIDGSLPSGYKSWQWAASRTWCTGSGLINDPYVIKNLVIDGWQNGSCIYIHDSTGLFHYFRIENSTLYNSSSIASPPDEPAGGIRLINVAHGTIHNNTIYDNGGHGIILRQDSYNITIRNNVIKNNKGTGVYINGSMCYDNLIFNNTIISNGEHGIVISDYAYRNEILNNYLYDNIQTGVFIEEGGFSGNYIINNTIISGRVGIGIDGRESVAISFNNISYTSSHGIAIQYSDPMVGMDIHDINITGNIIHNCGDDGISFGWNNSKHSMNNRITDNYIYDNTDAGISLQECDGSIFAKNTLDNNYVGIALEFLSSFNEFRDNMILNSDDQGLVIFDLDSIENRIYGNNFTGNALNGFDFGLDNHWYWMDTGNYWDDYPGNDTDDDGIGDTPYNIEGLTSPKDMFPEWWDAPFILKMSPIDNGEFPAENPPDYEIQIKQGIGDVFWYEILGTGTTSPYMKLNGIPNEIRAGKIEKYLWDPLAAGTYTIRFYTNDSQSYIGYQDVFITKLNVSSVITPSGGSDGSSSSDDEGTEEEGYPWYIQAAMTGAVSAAVGLVIKQVYSSTKKRRLILEKIHENFAKVENLEKFLKDSLDYEAWQRLEEPWKQYQNEEITERKLIKKAKKSLGKRFTELFIPHKKSRRRTT